MQAHHFDILVIFEISPKEKPQPEIHPSQGGHQPHFHLGEQIVPWPI